MKSRTLVLLASAAFALAAASAQAQTDVVKTKGCVNCHDAEKKKVGPSVKEIAAKKGNADEMVAKLKDAKGHPKVNATEAEIKAAVDQMLATK